METFKRLLGFLRPYRRALIYSLVLASAAMGMTVLIPALVGKAVDAIQSGERPDLLPLGLAIVGAGILRLGLTVVRRLVAGKVSLGVEYDLRGALLLAPAGARAGLLRLAPDRPAHVARHGRPAVDPVLPRLRADLHHPERAHDRARERGDDRAEAVAGGARPDPGSVRDRDRGTLQPHLPPSAAGGPAADRRAHRRGRGERLGGQGDQGFRARAARAGALPALVSTASSTRRSTRPGCARSTRR